MKYHPITTLSLVHFLYKPVFSISIAFAYSFSYIFTVYLYTQRGDGILTKI